MNKVTAADWIGREETVQTRLDPSLSAMMAATLDRIAPQDGDVLPPALALGRLSAAGADERRSARTGTHGRAASCHRSTCRAGCGQVARWHFLRPLHVGERLTAPFAHRRRRRTSPVRPGRMVFVTVEHDMAGKADFA